jgi:hypothetical protein
LPYIVNKEAGAAQLLTETEYFPLAQADVQALMLDWKCAFHFMLLFVPL